MYYIHTQVYTCTYTYMYICTCMFLRLTLRYVVFGLVTRLNAQLNRKAHYLLSSINATTFIHSGTMYINHVPACGVHVHM